MAALFRVLGLTLGRSEVIVDADLAAVDVQRAAGDSWRQRGGKEGLATEAAIQIFGLDRPTRHEHPLDACARGPAGQRLAVAEDNARRGCGDLRVGDGEA